MDDGYNFWVDEAAVSFRTIKKNGTVFLCMTERINNWSPMFRLKSGAEHGGRLQSCCHNMDCLGTLSDAQCQVLLSQWAVAERVADRMLVEAGLLEPNKVE